MFKPSDHAKLYEGQSDTYSKGELKVYIVGLMSCAGLAVSFKTPSGEDKIYAAHVPSGLIEGTKYYDQLLKIRGDNPPQNFKWIYWPGHPDFLALKSQIELIKNTLGTDTVMPNDKAALVIVDCNTFTVTNGAQTFSVFVPPQEVKKGIDPSRP